MGCSQSKIENEEVLSRCKDRKQFIKEAIYSRNAFAAAHTAYAICLKKTGAALCDYTQGEFSLHPSSVAAAAGVTSSLIEKPPPPPPSPNFQNPVPFQRAVSMPEIKPKVELKSVGPTIMEDDELEFEDQDNEKLTRKRSSSSRGSVSNREEAIRGTTMNQGMSWGDYIFAQAEAMRGPSLAEPVVEELSRKVFEEKINTAPPPEKEQPQPERESEPALVVEEKVEKTVELPVPMPVGEKKGVKKAGGEMGIRSYKRASSINIFSDLDKPASLIQIFSDLDDHFLKACESAYEVSNMLNATILRGHIDHSQRIMRVVTWNRSFIGLPSDDDFDTEEYETHATVLDTMLAWEEKLYDEVKAGKIMKYEYQKKVALLNKQKKRGSNPESLEKLEASVSHLHTRYIIAMQSMDSTVAEINRLRDEQLYPILVQLLDGMATMWKTMRYHHGTQSKIVYALKSLDISSEAIRETSEYHYDRTIPLCGVVRDWHTQFGRLINYQKEYVRALQKWLNLNLIPIESNLKEEVSSPPRVHSNPPIHRLVLAWNDDLEKLPDEVARSAISNFAAVIQTIMHQQDEEIKMKEKCEGTRKELEHKGKQYRDWCMKNGVIEELEPDNPLMIAKEERETIVVSLREKLEEDEEECRKICREVREKSLESLELRLPELFWGMSEIGLACSLMYSNLRSIADIAASAENLTTKEKPNNQEEKRLASIGGIE